MAVNYVTVLKTNRMQDVADVINAKTITAATGAGNTAKLVIGDATLSGATGVLSTHILANPVGTVSGAVLTITLPSAVNATATGTAAKASIRTSADVDIVTGLVCGVGSGEVQLNSLSITSGQSVNITAASITHS